MKRNKVVSKENEKYKKWVIFYLIFFYVILELIYIGSRYTPEKLLLCREGTYYLPEEMEKEWEEKGYKVKRVEIFKKDVGDRKDFYCVMRIVFDEPLIKMTFDKQLQIFKGTKIYYIDYKECIIPCVNKIIKDKKLTVYKRGIEKVTIDISNWTKEELYKRAEWQCCYRFI